MLAPTLAADVKAVGLGVCVWHGGSSLGTALLALVTPSAARPAQLGPCDEGKGGREDMLLSLGLSGTGVPSPCGLVGLYGHRTGGGWPLRVKDHPAEVTQERGLA